MESFVQWFKLDTLKLSDLTDFGNFSAVYVIRNSENKEILKYGCTGKFLRRIIGNFLGGIGGGTTARVHEHLFHHNEMMINKVEISWIKTKDARNIEKQLLKDYKQKFKCYPPWGR